MRLKDFFFVGFEWFDVITYKIVKEYDDLVNQNDYEFWEQYFSSNQVDSLGVTKKLTIINRCKNLVIRSLLLFKNFILGKKKYFVAKTAIIENKKLVIIKNFAEIKDYVIVRTYENPIVIGEYTQLNPFTVIYGGSGVYIGNNVMIAPHCMIAAGDHNYKQTTKPMRFADSISKGPIYIEDNVWIGANCTITDGVHIGKDAVVAANSVVIRDVAPYEIVGGVPAKMISNRLSTSHEEK
jgi:acetyltransferase-like isoleucine patch superfamily enzyme